MGVRKTHNRVKDSNFFSKDINETIKMAKKHYKVFGEFYVNVIQMNNEKTYYADYKANATTIKRFRNEAKMDDRAKWEEIN
jgi:hypothetical protein